MVRQSLYSQKEESFTEKHELLIIFLLCVFVIISVFLVAYAINDPNIYTSVGSV